jgi:sec-independent protein translocase protein TatA
MGISLSHILILLIIVLIFFRPRKVTDLGKSMGQAYRNFKQSLNEIEVDPKDIQEIPTPKKDKQESKEQSN